MTLKDPLPANVGLSLDHCLETWVVPSVSVLESWVLAVDFVVKGVELALSKSWAGVVAVF